MKKFALLFVLTSPAFAYGPYDQQYTFNQQYGSTNWYSSPLGMGVAQAGVTLIGGLVNAMSRPDPVQYMQQPNQPTYVNGGGGNTYNPQNCHMESVYNAQHQPMTVKICE